MARATRGSVKDERSWWTQRWFVASGALFAVLVLLGLYTAISGGGASSPPPPAAAAPAGRAAPPLRSSASSPRGCSLPAGDQAEPTTAPQASWELVGTMAAPSSPSTAGPQSTVDGVRACFAHSPLGALYATVNFWAEGTALPGVKVYRRLAADTPARTQAIADAGQDPGFRLDSLTKLQVAGFAITSYSGDSATIAVAFQLANGAFYAAPLAMAWQDGDWKAVIPAGGGAPGAGQIPDLTGYVAWSGA